MSFRHVFRVEQLIDFSFAPSYFAAFFIPNCSQTYSLLENEQKI